MRSVHIMVVGIATSIAASFPALAADNTPLNVKPGLWEITSDVDHSGMPPIPPDALAKLSPEQRAKIEAAMQQSMGPRHRVDKRCVTQDEIAKGFGEMDQMGHGKCTQNVTTSSATLREGTFACTGAQSSSGNYRFEARSPEAVVANWDMTMSGGGNTMKMKSAMQGKWLRADCGSVKP